MLQLGHCMLSDCRLNYAAGYAPRPEAGKCDAERRAFFMTPVGNVNGPSARYITTDARQCSDPRVIADLGGGRREACLVDFGISVFLPRVRAASSLTSRLATSNGYHFAFLISIRKSCNESQNRMSKHRALPLCSLMSAAGVCQMQSIFAKLDSS